MGLAAQLRSFDDAHLAQFLDARRDLVERAPADFEQLAARAAGYGSQLACLSGLDLFAHQLLELVALAGSPTTLERVAALAGPTVGRADLAAGFERLHGLGLVAFQSPSIRLIGELTGRLGVPGLGRPAKVLLEACRVEELRGIMAALGVRSSARSTRKADLLSAIVGHLEDPGCLRRMLEAAPPEVAQLLDRLEQERSATFISYASFAYGPRPGADPESRAAHWLRERGLLVQVVWGTAELIGEVGLLRRGGVAFPHLTARPPPLTASPGEAALDGPVPADDAGAARGSDVARDAGAAAARLVDLLARLCHTLDAAPAPQLKTGGLGVRAVRGLATTIGLDEVDTAALLETAAAAGLISRTASDIRPSALATPWSELELADRWLHVLRSWLSARSPLRIGGSPGGEGRPATVLGGASGDGGVVRRRRDLLDLLATVPVGRRVDPGVLGAHLLWLRPHLWAGGPADPDLVVRRFLEEATFLGAAVDGALAPAVRCELAGDPEGAHAAAAGALPAEESGFIVQADLTVLALGLLDPRVAGELGRFADVESRGGATVHRLSPAGVGRALQSGGSAEEILDFLRTHSRSGVPQPVEVLVRDVARRYGRVRVGSAASFLRCHDEALLAELVRHRKLAKLGLRQVAPTVAISAAEPEVVLDAVAGAGYLPAEEDGGGELVVRRSAEPSAAGGRGLLAGPGRPPTAGPPARAPGAASTTAAGQPGTIAERIEAAVRRLRHPDPSTTLAAGPPGSAAALWSEEGSGGRGGDGSDTHGIVTDPDLFPAMLRLARAESLGVGLGVLDEEGIVDLVGTPVRVHTGGLALLCGDCDDVHELTFEEIDWVELLDPLDVDPLDVDPLDVDPLGARLRDLAAGRPQGGRGR